MFFDDDDDAELGTQQGGLLLSSSSQPAHDGKGSVSGGASIVLDLIYATENERNCPTILPYPMRVIDTVCTLLQQQMRAVDRLEEEEQREARDVLSSAASSLLPFRPSGIMQADIQRVKFFLSELLRTRLAKIERLCTAIAFENEDSGAGGGHVSMTPPTGGEGSGLRSALSVNELMLAEQLAKMQQQCVLNGALHLLPEPLQYLHPNLPHGEGDEILPVPDTSAYVFILALVDLGTVTLDADVEQDIRAGEIFLVPYKALAPFVAEGKARLV